MIGQQRGHYQSYLSINLILSYRSDSSCVTLPRTLQISGTEVHTININSTDYCSLFEAFNIITDKHESKQLLPTLLKSLEFWRRNNTTCAYAVKHAFMIVYTNI